MDMVRHHEFCRSRSTACVRNSNRQAAEQVYPFLSFGGMPD
jgi:hypothetical protein